VGGKEAEDKYTICLWTLSVRLLAVALNAFLTDLQAARLVYYKGLSAGAEDGDVDVVIVESRATHAVSETPKYQTKASERAKT